MLKLLALLLSMLGPAQAQNFIQIPACGNSLPASIRPSAPTITMNPSGQVCVSGNFSVSILTPLSINIPQVSAVVSGAYADGALVTLGQVGEAAYKTVNTSGDVIALLKGIFGNVMTPISVTGSFTPAAATGVDITHVASQQIASPSTYGVAPVGSVLGVNAFVTSLPASPLGVAIAASSSPVNVTVGNGNANGQNTKANSSPVVLPTDQTPLNVTLAASPLNVTGNFSGSSVTIQNIVASPISVLCTGCSAATVVTVQTIVASPVAVLPTPSPQNVTLAASPLDIVADNVNANGLATMANSSPVVIASDQTPVSVNIATASSPLNVTGNFTAAAPASPQGVAISGIGVNITPMNVTVGNGNANGLAASSGSSPVVIASDQTPIKVTIVTGVSLATPLNVTLVASPLNVTNVGSPQNVTVATSPIGVTITSSPVNVTGNFNAARTVTNIAWNPGSANNGILATAVTLLSTELEGLIANSVTLSSVNGSSGVFNNTNTLQAVVAVCQFYEGNPGIVAPGAGGNVSMWLAPSIDGVNYEYIPTNTTFAIRPPDAIFALPPSTISSPQFFSATGLVNFPPTSFKVYAANNAANTLGTGAQNVPSIRCAPVAVEN